MVGLYKDPEGKMLFIRTNPSQGNINSSMDKDTIAVLKKRVQELESEVSVIPRFELVSVSVILALVYGVINV